MTGILYGIFEAEPTRSRPDTTVRAADCCESASSWATFHPKLLLLRRQDWSRDEAYKWEEAAVRALGRALGTCSTHNATATMEAAICTLVSQFKTFAGKDGSSSTLSKEEFHNLVTSQLPNFVKDASNPRAMAELMGSLDEDNDGELTFPEFWQLLGTLASKQGGFS
ncbi:hypothetical protein fugu_018532 [Takifugu bimaculatus]|uniref:EF-hand domain-containing protein n=1 Tax=Takifugu bimaculatus TaxID=433685 RepID=A0A4Z2BPE3_9TELE|nr:hypothetical protein fugu_018532 [Takifugu bimaculatus]